MTNKEFCNWLHGYFELTRVKSKSVFLNAGQMELVREHIEDISDAYACTFVQWLQGVIDATRVLKMTNVDYVNVSEAIKLKLGDYLNSKDEIIPATTPAPKFDRLRIPRHDEEWATNKLEDALDKLPEFPAGRTPSHPYHSTTVHNRPVG